MNGSAAIRGIGLEALYLLAMGLGLQRCEAGMPIRPRNLLRQFIGLLQKAGLPATIRFHDLRRFAATTLLSNGVDISTTQAVLGHIDASVTLNFMPLLFQDTRGLWSTMWSTRCLRSNLIRKTIGPSSSMDRAPVFGTGETGDRGPPEHSTRMR